MSDAKIHISNDIADETSPQPQPLSGNGRYLCFSLGPEDYAIPLLSVKEVIALPEITPVPQTPTYYMGIINLRGQIISVLDIRSKLGIKPIRSTETAVIICDIEPNSIGVVVDSINYVANPPAEDLKPKPDIQSYQPADHIINVFRSNGKLILVLDVRRVLTVSDQQAIQKTQMQKAG
jgi:purine-binding chemotaxis protein CheW